MPLTPADEERLARGLVDLIRPVERELNRELRAIIDDETRASRVRRLRELLDEIAAWKADVRGAARSIIAETHREAYQIGALIGADRVGSTFQWTQFHRQALGGLVDDTFAEVLRSTEHMGDDVKALIRELARSGQARKLVAGQTATQAGRVLEQRLRTTGLTSVVYSDGRNIRLSTYTNMLMRTKGSLGATLGSMAVYDDAGVDTFECVDGSLCGWASHGDGQKANGLIVSAEMAWSQPIAHPNCRRDFLPRPDLSPSRTGQRADRLSQVDAASRVDQATFERWLDRGVVDRARSRQRAQRSRARREGRTRRAPRSPRRSTPTTP